MHKPLNAKAIELAEKQRRACEMRCQGKTYDEIAAELGYAGKSGAYHAVATAVAELPREAADELRAMELEKLNKMETFLWEQARQGDQFAIDRLLKIQDRRAKLMGLDSPTKYSADVKQTLEPFEPADKDMVAAAADLNRFLATKTRFDTNGHSGN